MLIANKFLATKLSYTREKNNAAFEPLFGSALDFKEHKKLLLKLSKYSCELNTAFCEKVSLFSDQKVGRIIFISTGIFSTTRSIIVYGACSILSGRIFDWATLVVYKPRPPITNIDIPIVNIILDK